MQNLMQGGPLLRSRSSLWEHEMGAPFMAEGTTALEVWQLRQLVSMLQQNDPAKYEAYLAQTMQHKTM